jgi:hypothetical protein
MRKFTYSVAIVAIALTLGLQTSFADSAKVRAAQEAAEEWLALVDAGDYDASWDETSSFFKSQVSKDAWRRQVAKARGPYGAVKSRKVAGSQYATELPNAPDGEYVIFQYLAAFEKKSKAVETITPMLDADGKWRVSGYYIR